MKFVGGFHKPLEQSNCTLWTRDVTPRISDSNVSIYFRALPSPYRTSISLTTFPTMTYYPLLPLKIKTFDYICLVAPSISLIYLRKHQSGPPRSPCPPTAPASSPRGASNTLSSNSSTSELFSSYHPGKCCTQISDTRERPYARRSVLCRLAARAAASHRY